MASVAGNGVSRVCFEELGSGDACSAEAEVEAPLDVLFLFLFGLSAAWGCCATADMVIVDV